MAVRSATSCCPKRVLKAPHARQRRSQGTFLRCFCLSSYGTSVGGTSHRLTHIIFVRSHPDPLRAWGQKVRAETKELWLNLCERAADEQDPDRLLAIVEDMKAALELKIGRLKQADTRLGRNALALTPCILCNNPVPLGSSKTNEDGKAVHEECYLLRMRLQRATSNNDDVHA
jgi:hypothetical protein